MAKIGVIVGRFQVPELHAGHKYLIQEVQSKSDRMVVVIGTSPIPTTRVNPLPPISILLTLSTYLYKLGAKYITAALEDITSNESWSDALDSLIRAHTIPNDEVTLYGSRDSFIASYKGKYRTEIILPLLVRTTSTEVREGIGKDVVQNNLDFTKGIIWATQNQFPRTLPTVDVAIIDYDRVLLCRKPNEKLWRFPGGFAEPDSPSYEFDASREAREETGLEISPPEYLGSFLIDDWRYRKGPDKIKTLFFKANRMWGAVEAKDDIREAKWFNINSMTRLIINDPHIPLYETLLNHHYLRNNYAKTKPNS